VVLDENKELTMAETKETTFEEYKFPKSYIETRINNNINGNNYNYNCLSCFYNDSKNI
jgi:hypothetical protein